MKKYFVEVTVGIYMDEMDDDNSTESVAELADRLVNECISDYWNADIVTTPTLVVELNGGFDAALTLDTYLRGMLH